jgi:hypothetical protein
MVTLSNRSKDIFYNNRHVQQLLQMDDGSMITRPMGGMDIS